MNINKTPHISSPASGGLTISGLSVMIGLPRSDGESNGVFFMQAPLKNRITVQRQSVEPVNIEAALRPVLVLATRTLTGSTLCC